MFTTSRDILNLVLSVSIAIFAFFLCWSLYYFIASVRNIHRVIKRIEEGVAKAEEVVFLIKEKVKSNAIYLTVLGEVAKRAMDFMKEKREKKAESKKK
ncbi:MAG: hypothetical protein WC545_04320 [Patescibacteria group bacterium]